MEDSNSPFSSPNFDSSSPPVLSDTPRTSSFLAGPNGLRAGWRLLIFFAILSAFASLEMAVSRFILHRHIHANALTAQGTFAGEAGVFALVLAASFVMARIEKRTISVYGLPWRRAFRSQFWQGLALGFASITALLGSMWAAGVLHFGFLTLHGIDLWKYAVLWALAFLFVGLFEEFFFRGYVLYTLTTGIGIWPAAVLCSIAFGYVHHGNPGETWIGAFAAGLVGFIFCLLLRRTGDLWMAIGFHMSWDWGETYFYGVPDSGQVAPGHLLNATVAGPQWLTGGSVGPEGSWLCILLLILLALLFAAWFPDVKYPGPESSVSERPAGNSANVAVV